MGSQRKFHISFHLFLYNNNTGLDVHFGGLSCFFLKIFFLIWTVFKVFVECVTILLLFYFFFFFFLASGLKAYRIFTPQPGIKPACPALESAGLTTGPPGKSHLFENYKEAWGPLHEKIFSAQN